MKNAVWKLIKLSLLIVILWALPSTKAHAGICGPDTFCGEGCPMGWKCDYNTCWCVPCDGPQDPECYPQ